MSFVGIPIKTLPASVPITGWLFTFGKLYSDTNVRVWFARLSRVSVVTSRIEKFLVR